MDFSLWVKRYQHLSYLTVLKFHQIQNLPFFVKLGNWKLFAISAERAAASNLTRQDFVKMPFLTLLSQSSQELHSSSFQQNLYRKKQWMTLISQFVMQQQASTTVIRQECVIQMKVYWLDQILARQEFEEHSNE